MAIPIEASTSYPPQLRLIKGGKVVLKFILPDNKVVEGKSYDDIVMQMSSTKYTTPRSLLSYRRACARRLKSGMAPSVRIRTGTSQMFVEDLETLKFIERLETIRS